MIDCINIFKLNKKFLFMASVDSLSKVTRVSERALRSPPSAIASLREEVVSLLSKGQKVIDLSSGDFYQDIEYPGFKKNMHNSIDTKYHRYPHSKGLVPTRNNILSLLLNEGFTNLNIEDILITNGGIQALDNISHVILDLPIIIPTPFWGPVVSQNQPFRTILYSHLTQNLQLDLNHIENLLTQNDISAIYVNSPHNPTGTVFSKTSLENIVHLSSQHKVPIIFDEAYDGLVYDEEQDFSPSEFLDLENSFLVRSFSKSHSLSGYRIGYLVTRNKVYMSHLANRQLLSTSGVNSPTQDSMATLDLVSSLPDVRDYYKVKRNILMELAKVNGFSIDKPPEGAIYLWIRIGIPKEIPVSQRDDYGINLLKSLETPVFACRGTDFGPGYSDYIRLAFSVASPEELKQVVEMASEKYGFK